MTARRVYFHEDDFCQIELVPAENWKHCATEMGNVATFSEAHEAPGGVGWTDVYPRVAEPVSLVQAALNLNEVDDLLAAHLERFDTVETGYSSHVEECKHIVAFGFDASCVIYFSERDGIVDHIWLGLDGPPSSQQDKLISAFASLNQRVSLILADWGWEALIRLSDQDSLKAYLGSREERMTAFRKEWEARKKIETARRPWWKFWG